MPAQACVWPTPPPAVPPDLVIERRIRRPGYRYGRWSEVEDSEEVRWAAEGALSQLRRVRVDLHCLSE